MGIYVDYTAEAECSEQELAKRMQRARDRIAQLDVLSVDKVHRLDPVYNMISYMLVRMQGLKFPAAVAKRLKNKSGGDSHEEYCLQVCSPMMHRLPHDKQIRHFQPLLDYLKTDHGLWKPSDYPDRLGDASGQLSLQNPGIDAFFGSIMIGRAFVLFVDPGEGCEPICFALSTYGQGDNPYWLGAGFTQTGHSHDFAKTHETVCRILDIGKEEGIITEVLDSSGFFEHRDWRQSPESVAEASSGIKSMMMLFGAGANDMVDSLGSSPLMRGFNLIGMDYSDPNSQSQSQSKPAPKDDPPKGKDKGKGKDRKPKK